MKNRIKIFRSRANITQSKLADKVGVSRQTINAIEKDRINPSVLIAFKIARVLDTFVDDLFLLDEADHPGALSTGPLIIGIGGVSQSGKSTLANRIRDRFADRIVRIISLDDFTVPEEQMPRVHGLPDWEVPESYDYEAMRQKVMDLAPVSDLIIIEGILPFNHSELTREMGMKIFMEIPYDTFLERRKRETRWGEEPEWYYDHVWNRYLQHGNIKEQRDDMICLDGSHDVDMEDLTRRIRSEIHQ